MNNKGRLPEDIPLQPERVYAAKGWKGMGDWLGTSTIAPRLRVYLPFAKAREFVRKLRLKSSKEWIAFCKGEMPDLERPANIPAKPNKTYADKGWAGMGDWLGTGTIAPRLRIFRAFHEARAFARHLKLKRVSEWRAFCKGNMPHLGLLPEDIPANPNSTYDDQGWTDWGDWLGTGNIASILRTYRPFQQARTFARNLKLKSGTEWSAFCKSEMPQLGRLPADIPACPNQTYADKGWSGIGDWLGTGRARVSKSPKRKS